MDKSGTNASKWRAVADKSAVQITRDLFMTIASMTVSADPDREDAPKGRATGILAIATGLAAFALLAAHPSENATTFADVIKIEAEGQVVAAIVHGGFIAILALQLICYVIFSARLGLQRVATIAGLVFFAMGVAFFCASLLVDGLVLPAVAARYVVKPDKIESARMLFVLLGTMASFLMPIGLAFQSAAIATWGWALAARGSRGLGVFGIIVGCLMVVALVASFAVMNPFVMMAAIAATGLWAIMVGAAMMRGF